MSDNGMWEKGLKEKYVRRKIQNITLALRKIVSSEQTEMCSKSYGIFFEYSYI